MKSSIIKRSVTLGGRKTSMSLEDAFWKGLLDIARRRGVTISQLIESIDANRTQTNLSSAARLFVLAEFRDQIAPPLEPKQTRALSR